MKPCFLSIHIRFRARLFWPFRLVCVLVFFFLSPKTFATAPIASSGGHSSVISQLRLPYTCSTWTLYTYTLCIFSRLGHIGAIFQRASPLEPNRFAFSVRCFVVVERSRRLEARRAEYSVFLILFTCSAHVNLVIENRLPILLSCGTPINP